MLDHHDGVAEVGQSVENREQALDVGEMQTRGRLVEDVKRATGRGATELGGQLDPLGFAAGERACSTGRASGIPARRRGAHRALRRTRGTASKSCAALVDAHLQHVADRLSLEAHFERLTVEPLAAAFLAGHVQVGEEMHRAAGAGPGPGRLRTGLPWR